MACSLTELKQWMSQNENEQLEFKEAKSSFEFDNLVNYCVALANENGGTLVLGVSDKSPRKIVGSSAFPDLERTKLSLMERLHLRVEASAIQDDDGRVVIFQVPSRPIGTPIQYKGCYWMRSGESLVPMTADQLKRIFAESGPDYSAELCPGTTINDLDAMAIKRFRELWARKTGIGDIQQWSSEQLLGDSELFVEGQATYAAIALLGTSRAVARHLSQSEVIFEYRSSESSIPYQQRKEYRQGFLLYDVDLWQTINLRNEIQQHRDGLFVWDIHTFNEAVVREAILNAICHRDYRLHGSVFVRQFPRMIEIVSPGGFPPGITAENILFRQFPRNRRIAEALSKCGLVERSGQGADRMFVESIRESKPRPDFTHTDEHQVAVTLRGEVQNPSFLSFLAQATNEGLGSFATKDLIVLDSIQREQNIPSEFKDRLVGLLDSGVIERVNDRKNSRYILSRRLYAFLGKRGVYTRRRGLDRNYNKALLLKHIRDSGQEGVKLSELLQVLPHHTKDQVQKLLGSLKKENEIGLTGRANAARWYCLTLLTK